MTSTNGSYELTVTEMEEYPFTPLQEMIVETLLARHRLGDNSYPIKRAHPYTVALDKLVTLGVVKYGNGGDYWRVSLTEDAKKAFIKSEYNPPVVAEIAELKEQIKGFKAVLRAFASCSEGQTW